MVTVSFVIAIISWLLPFLITLTKNKVNLTHPIVIFPLFVVFTLCVPFSEYLFAWSNKFEFRGLRYISTEIIGDGGGAYVRANFYMGVSAVFYFFGIYLKNAKKLLPREQDFITIQNYNFSKSSKQFFIFIFLIPILTLPLFLFGYSDAGTYFIYIISTFIYFIPAVLAFFNLTAFIIAFAVVIPLLFIVLSKGNIFYLFLWALIPFDFLRGNNFKRVLIGLMGLLIGIILMNKMIEARADKGFEASTDDVNFIYTFFYREYGFDGFAGDVYNSINDEKTKGTSYILTNVKELMPAKVHEFVFNKPKIRYGNLIGFEVYKEDKHSEAGTGFQRYFLLDFYHDFGFLGIPIISFIYGWGMMFWYRKNITLYIKTLNRLYLVKYVTLCFNLHFLVNGLLYYAITTFIGMNLLVFIFQFLTNRKSHLS